MFSLLVTILAIALVVLLVMATIYYGGKSMTTAATKAAATAVLNQSTQISAAGALSIANGHGWPATTLQFPHEILTMPVPPVAAYVSSIKPTAQDWAYFRENSNAFGLRNKLSKKVCMEVNRQLGFYGIPMALGSGTRHLCYGRSEPYSYFNAPSDVPDAIRDAIISDTVNQATDELAANPVETVVEDSPSSSGGGIIGVAVPGYPVLCPSGLVINGGSCAGSNGVQGPPGNPNPPITVPEPEDTSMLVTSNPGVLNLDGSPHDMPGTDSISVCTIDASPGAVDRSAVFSIGGVPLVTRANWQTFGAQCLGVSGTPAMPAGVVATQLVTSSGEVLTGTITYAPSLAKQPVVSEISPYAGSAKVQTVVKVTGSGFTQSSQAFAEANMALATRYVNSSTLFVTMPVAEKLGLLKGGNTAQVTNIYVENSGSLKSTAQTGTMTGTFQYGATPRISQINVMGAAAEPGVGLNVQGAGLVPQSTFTMDGVEMPVRAYMVGNTVAEITVPDVSPGVHKITIHVPGWAPIDSEVGVLIKGDAPGGGGPSLTPSTVSSSGGELVTIKGVPANSYAFAVVNGRQVASTVVDSETLTFQAPALPAGSYDVMVAYQNAAPVPLTTKLVVK